MNLLFKHIVTLKIHELKINRMHRNFQDAGESCYMKNMGDAKVVTYKRKMEKQQMRATNRCVILGLDM